jgi:hypothetical protein
MHQKAFIFSCLDISSEFSSFAQGLPLSINSALAASAFSLSADDITALGLISTLAVASQVMPSSRSNTALARRPRRCAAGPSRASSIRSLRDSAIEEAAPDHEND